ncbi:hypothetical protein [Phyllobacterium phragmitis]|uniref:hypothetical protein n=1 Tax=Phyllobacterium phragmitis TaxID=2670329 RepID=UPI001FE0961C|nr:hypothetical protein [Phyllobacterium phragmitis]
MDYRAPSDHPSFAVRHRAPVHALASRFHCGVDFGTTNSTVGLCARGSDPFLIPVEGDHLTIPSALFFSLEDGSVHFGRSAVHEYMDGAEGRFMRALKSILGTSLMKETTLVGRDRVTFQGLIGRFLRHLKTPKVQASPRSRHLSSMISEPSKPMDSDRERN